MDLTSSSAETSVSATSEELERLKQAHLGCLREIDLLRSEVEENVESARIAQDELQYFVYAASHDLQQPLRAIGTHAQLLQREYAGDERAMEFTSVIIEGAAQMNGLIRDLLNYSRTGNVSQPATVNLNGPLQWALFNVADAVRETGAKVTVGEMPEVLADEKQMVTVFEHLLSNSLRYRASEPPALEISSESGEDFHTISVHDNGMGVKPEYREKIFEPFKRLHSKNIPGSGLGLSICRKIVRLHHGKIWLESDGEHGSTVRFTLPV